MDTDPQGSALSWSEEAEADGYELPFAVMGLPTRDVHRKLSKVAGDYAHVVIDTPPGRSRSPARLSGRRRWRWWRPAPR